MKILRVDDEEDIVIMVVVMMNLWEGYMYIDLIDCVEVMDFLKKLFRIEW